MLCHESVKDWLKSFGISAGKSGLIVAAVDNKGTDIKRSQRSLRRRDLEGRELAVLTGQVRERAWPFKVAEETSARVSGAKPTHRSTGPMHGGPATARAGATGNSCRWRIRAGSAWGIDSSVSDRLLGVVERCCTAHVTLPAVDHRHALDLTKHMTSHVKGIHRRLDVTTRAEGCTRARPHTAPTGCRVVEISPRAG